MSKQKLNNIRKKIDKLDRKLLDIIKKRTGLVEEVIKTKKLKKQIVDKKRIEKVLNNIKKLSKKRKIDARITNKIWKSMINSYIEYERRNFKKK
jgi:chorismate mutase